MGTLDTRLKRLEQKALQADYQSPDVEIVYVEPDGSRSDPIKLKEFFARGKLEAGKETMP
ncbi:hypothetical protein FJY94_07920 [Candidatus Kaiserbacteria bacterium]|nr:hypothetical protein [Candidatus Kaiserbacteria bacterium]